jgi:hypothetical protein
MTEKNAKYWILFAAVALVLAGVVFYNLGGDSPAPVPKDPKASQMPVHPMQNQELSDKAKQALAPFGQLKKLRKVLLVSLNCPGCDYIFEKVKWSRENTNGLLIVVMAQKVQEADLPRLIPGLPGGARLALDSDGVIKQALQIKGAPELLILDSGKLVFFSKGGRSIAGYLNDNS